jgi:prephenate dehydrogenase
MRGDAWRCLVAGGSGEVGRLFADLLAGAGHEVVSVDLAVRGVQPGSGIRQLAGDIAAPEGEVRELVVVSDLVLLAVPERVALAAVPRLARSLRAHSLLMDTLSVKTRILEVYRGLDPGIEVLSLNPLFAPALGINGRPIAAVAVSDGPRARAFRGELAVWGARVAPVEAAEHDRLTASLQGATHAAVLSLGLALAAQGVDIALLRGLAPPPHLNCLALLARMVTGTPEVYWDIQAGNPHAVQARRALADSLRRLSTVIEAGDEAEFQEIFSELSRFLGEHQSSLAETCAGIFRHLPC